MTHSNIFTPDDYVLAQVLKYPGLFSSSSLDRAKFKVFDQLFNTIGNGISNDKELLEELTYYEFDKDRAMELVLKDFDRFRDPYPNFQKKYSVVWTSNFKEFGPEWCDAAIWFYDVVCREYFDDGAYDYYEKYPCANNRETQDRIRAMNQIALRVSKEELLREFSLDYNGDMHEALCNKWNNQLQNIYKFIDNTVDMLKG